MSIDDQPCTFSYGPSPETPDSKKPEAVDPAKHPEWIALAEHFRHNESMMAEARRVDPMPDPSVITVGQTIVIGERWMESIQKMERHRASS
jgi:hypothetical protein